MNVAVVIPSYNEEAYIEACVMSVVNNVYDKGELEIYVVDGQSDDRTRSIVNGIIDKHENVHLIDNPKKVTPVALNLGLKTSTADVKIILGAHSVVANDFILANVQVLQDYPEAGCAGGVINKAYHGCVAIPRRPPLGSKKRRVARRFFRQPKGGGPS